MGRSQPTPSAAEIALVYAYSLSRFQGRSDEFEDGLRAFISACGYTLRDDGPFALETLVGDFLQSPLQLRIPVVREDRHNVSLEIILDYTVMATRNILTVALAGAASPESERVRVFISGATIDVPVLRRPTGALRDLPQEIGVSVRSMYTNKLLRDLISLTTVLTGGEIPGIRRRAILNWIVLMFKRVNEANGRAVVSLNITSTAEITLILNFKFRIETSGFTRPTPVLTVEVDPSSHPRALAMGKIVRLSEDITLDQPFWLSRANPTTTNLVATEGKSSFGRHCERLLMAHTDAMKAGTSYITRRLFAIMTGLTVLALAIVVAVGAAAQFDLAIWNTIAADVTFIGAVVVAAIILIIAFVLFWRGYRRMFTVMYDIMDPGWCLRPDFPASHRWDSKNHIAKERE